MDQNCSLSNIDEHVSASSEMVHNQIYKRGQSGMMALKDFRNTVMLVTH
jgi:hypothetical protein